MQWEISTETGSCSPSQKQLHFFGFLEVFSSSLLHHFFSLSLQDAPKRMLTVVSHLCFCTHHGTYSPLCFLVGWGGIYSPSSSVELCLGEKSPSSGASRPRFKHCPSPLVSSWGKLLSYRDDNKSTLAIELSWELQEVIHENHLEYVTC